MGITPFHWNLWRFCFRKNLDKYKTINSRFIIDSIYSRSSFSTQKEGLKGNHHWTQLRKKAKIACEHAQTSFNCLKRQKQGAWQHEINHHWYNYGTWNITIRAIVLLVFWKEETRLDNYMEAGNIQTPSTTLKCSPWTEFSSRFAISIFRQKVSN